MENSSDLIHLFGDTQPWLNGGGATKECITTVWHGNGSVVCLWKLSYSPIGGTWPSMFTWPAGSENTLLYIKHHSWFCKCQFHPFVPPNSLNRSPVNHRTDTNQSYTHSLMQILHSANGPREEPTQEHERTTKPPKERPLGVFLSNRM